MKAVFAALLLLFQLQPVFGTMVCLGVSDRVAQEECRMPAHGHIETVSEHLKKRLPVHFPFFIAHSLITNGTVTVLVSHH